MEPGRRGCDSARRSTAHLPLEGLRGGVRQDSVSRLPAYPLLERVTGSACQDITGTPKVRRHFGVCRITAHTLRASSLGGARQEAFISSLTIHSLFACRVSERNMGQSLYLWFDSAGFCCWGLGMGRPFPAQITTQGHRGTFFRVVFRYLATAALSFSGRRHPGESGGCRH
jgi:hypothetical protein